MFKILNLINKKRNYNLNLRFSSTLQYILDDNFYDTLKKGDPPPKDHNNNLKGWELAMKRSRDTVEALKLYEEGIERLLLYVKEENNERISNEICLIIESYLKRAEYLKEKISCYESYDRGVLLINDAINADNLNEYEIAYKLYTDGIELILKYTQFENNSQNQRIYKQLESYLDRAEIMKRMMRSEGKHKGETINEDSHNNNNSNSNNSSSSHFIQPSAPPVSLCVICLSTPATNAMIPCGHLILCDECLTQQINDLNLCYICRTQLIPPKFLKIYTT